MKKGKLLVGMTLWALAGHLTGCGENASEEAGNSGETKASSLIWAMPQEYYEVDLEKNAAYLNRLLLEDGFLYFQDASAEEGRNDRTGRL